MKYRPHRGWLADAMKEAVEVDGLAGLLAHLDAAPERLTVKRYGCDDERIGWTDVHLVLLDGVPVGWCEGPAAPPNSA
jgi:hypothetical protein